MSKKSDNEREAPQEQPAAAQEQASTANGDQPEARQPSFWQNVRVPDLVKHRIEVVKQQRRLSKKMRQLLRKFVPLVVVIGLRGSDWAQRDPAQPVSEPARLSGPASVCHPVHAGAVRLAVLVHVALQDRAYPARRSEDHHLRRLLGAAAAQAAGAAMARPAVGSAAIRGDGWPLHQRAAAVRPTGHRQDDARQGDGRRGGGCVHFDRGLRLPRHVHGRRRDEDDLVHSQGAQARAALRRGHRLYR